MERRGYKKRDACTTGRRSDREKGRKGRIYLKQEDTDRETDSKGADVSRLVGLTGEKREFMPVGFYLLCDEETEGWVGS